MKLNISKNDLLNAINVVLKGTSSRSTLPILSGILFDAQDTGELVCQTTDLEISIRHCVQADIVEPGKIVLPGKLLADIVKTLPDAAVSVSTQQDQTHIECMGSSFALSSLPAADFPYFPEVDADTTVEIDSATLEKAVRKVSRAVSRDEGRAVLTGILFSVNDSKVRLVATDAYRLALVDLEIACGVDDFQAIVPGKIFDDVVRLASGTNTISIGFSDNQIVFKFGTTTFVSRKIEGTFPNYKQLIPDEHAVTVQIPTNVLVTAIKRASLLAQSHTPVRFVFSAQDQKLTISAKTQDVGNAEGIVEASIDGPDTEIAFNHQYILDGLNAIEGDTVIELQSSLKPGILKSTTDAGFLYLAMPVRLN